MTQSYWQTERNNFDGMFRVKAPVFDYLLDAATGLPAKMSGNDAMRAMQALAAIDVQRNTVVERVS